MAGYAVSARLQGAAPVFALSGDAIRRSTLASTGAIAAAEGGVTIDRLELVGRPLDETIAEWLASIGESFSQLTFFLFDPDSWR